MQCLSSPTRSEIDKAHSHGAWLDIGVPSMRNLGRLSTNRVVLWWLLAISSIPLHLLYNSAVFSTLGTNRFNAFFVSSDFTNGAPFIVMTEKNWGSSGFDYEQNVTMARVLQDYQKNQTSLVRLENKPCAEVYTAPILSTNSDVLFVSSHSNSTDSLISYQADLFSGLYNGYFMDYDNIFCYSSSTCNVSKIVAQSENWSDGVEFEGGLLTANPIVNTTTTPPDMQVHHPQVQIQYCLSVREEARCKLQFSPVIMTVIIICNLTKTVCMITVAWKQDPEPLVTLGDAISSFLDRPDVSTGGNCVAGRTRFEKSRSSPLLPCRWFPVKKTRLDNRSSWDLLPTRWITPRMRRFRAASSRRWLVCVNL